MKRCFKCMVIKPYSDFNSNKRAKDKVQTYCRPCQRKMDKEYYLKSPSRKKAIRETAQQRHDNLYSYVADYKEVIGCLKCGLKNPVCLDFHHLGSKVDEVSTMVRKGLKLSTIIEEIKKCVILCANCHRIEHYN